MSDTVKYPVFTPGNCTGACTGNGDYTLVVAGFDNCPSPPSVAKTVVFNNQAPISLPAPANFVAATPTQSSVKLSWADVSGETGFEIWRRKLTGSATYSAWSMPTITGANVTTFTDVTLEPSSTYHYKIRVMAPFTVLLPCIPSLFTSTAPSSSSRLPSLETVLNW